MSITSDFAERSRARIAETRSVITKLRDASKEAVRQLAKIDKQHVADRVRVSERVGQIADDVVDKLSEEADDTAFDRAYVIQEQVNDLASDLEEVSLASSSVEDLEGLLSDTIKEIYASLKETESQLAKVERVGTKLGI